MPTDHTPRPNAQSGELASYLELSAGAVRENLAVFRALEADAPGPRRRLGVVLKGNAYGHGFGEMLPLVHPLADLLYLITPSDAVAIRAWERASGLAPRQLLVLGAMTAAEAVALAQEGVDAVVADVEWREAIAPLRAAKLSRRLRVHVHIDSGLGREGFTAKQLEAGAARFLADAADVFEVVGVLSHFANTEDVTEQEYALQQLAAFEAGTAALTQSLKLSGPLERHMAASAAALVLPSSRYDAMRVGISLYGLWPSVETRLSAKLVLGQLPRLHPVLAWRCPSQTVKWISAGSYVGYGCTWRCPVDTRVAILPVGYFDGYPRLASGRAHVLVNGRRCAVLGRVMMNHLIVDVTGATGDERPVLATLIGKDGEESIPIESLAGWAQTIHYEIAARLGAHVKRVVVG